MNKALFSHMATPLVKILLVEFIYWNKIRSYAENNNNNKKPYIITHGNANVVVSRVA